MDPKLLNKFKLLLRQFLFNFNDIYAVVVIGRFFADSNETTIYI